MCSNSSTSMENHQSHASMAAIGRLPRITRNRKKSGRREQTKAGAEIEMMNLKLYLENRCIMAENQRLRERALLLCQENRALASQFQKILLQPSSFAAK